MSHTIKKKFYFTKNRPKGEESNTLKSIFPSNSETRSYLDNIKPSGTLVAESISTDIIEIPSFSFSKPAHYDFKVST